MFWSLPSSTGNIHLFNCQTLDYVLQPGVHTLFIVLNVAKNKLFRARLWPKPPTTSEPIMH